MTLSRPAVSTISIRTPASPHSRVPAASPRGARCCRRPPAGTGTPASRREAARRCSPARAATEIFSGRERQRHARVQMRARDGAHEQDDRHHHQPGATTAAARLICPSPCRMPPPAATSTRKNVPNSSENSLRYSSLGSIELRTRAKLERQQVLRPLRTLGRRCGRLRVGRGVRLGHARMIPPANPTAIIPIG